MLDTAHGEGASFISYQISLNKKMMTEFLNHLLDYESDPVVVNNNIPQHIISLHSIIRTQFGSTINY